jgi:DNA invertase Pin-like site-specific DNA recombinase
MRRYRNPPGGGPLEVVLHVAGQPRRRRNPRRVEQACDVCRRPLAQGDPHSYHPLRLAAVWPVGQLVAETIPRGARLGLLDPGEGVAGVRCRDPRRKLPLVHYVAYCRVSTESQAEGWGLKEQARACRAWAKANGHRILVVETDAGRPADSDVYLVDRPALRRCWGAVKERRAAGVIVARLDRLATVVGAQEDFRSEMIRLGGQLHSAVPSEDEALVGDPHDPARAMIRQSLSYGREYESRWAQVRLRWGAALKREAGGYVGGQTPYGWRAPGRGRDPVPHDDEQDQLQVMHRWRMEGWSYQAIADQLNANSCWTRHGRAWYRATVRRTLLESKLDKDHPIGLTSASFDR